MSLQLWTFHSGFVHLWWPEVLKVNPGRDAGPGGGSRLRLVRLYDRLPDLHHLLQQLPSRLLFISSLVLSCSLSLRFPPT